MGPSFRGPPTIPRSGSRRDLVTIVPSGIIIIPTNPSSKFNSCPFSPLRGHAVDTTGRWAPHQELSHPSPSSKPSIQSPTPRMKHYGPMNYHRRSWPITVVLKSRMAMLDSMIAQILLYLLRGIVIPLLPHYWFVTLILQCYFTFCFSQWLNVMKVG